MTSRHPSKSSSQVGAKKYQHLGMLGGETSSQDAAAEVAAAACLAWDHWGAFKKGI